MLLAVAVVAIEGCGTVNRADTLNQTATISGAAAELALKQELAKKGFPAAAVTCAKAITIVVGVAQTCSVSGAGPHGTVKFTIGNVSGKIDPGSVKAH
jgi:hypothetical protein